MMDILLVEPDIVLLKSYKSQLETHGLTVFVATDAGSAIEQIDDNQPQLVVLEMQLAGHSGVEFLHEFRSYEDWANIPVVVYSSVPEYVFGLDRAMWTKFGISRYLNKSKTSLTDLAGIIKTEIERANHR